MIYDVIKEVKDVIYVLIDICVTGWVVTTVRSIVFSVVVGRYFRQLALRDNKGLRQRALMDPSKECFGKPHT